MATPHAPALRADPDGGGQGAAPANGPRRPPRPRTSWSSGSCSVSTSTLERRLREAIAATVLEQTRSIAPLLREEIEEVVRETVAQAFADELAARQER